MVIFTMKLLSKTTKRYIAFDLLPNNDFVIIFYQKGFFGFFYEPVVVHGIDFMLNIKSGLINISSSNQVLFLVEFSGWGKVFHNSQ